MGKLARRDVDPEHVAYAGHSLSAGVGAKLTAVGKRIQWDQSIPEATVRKSFEAFQPSKRLEFCDAGHELNSAAGIDRVQWLQQRLNLKGVDLHALAGL